MRFSVVTLIVAASSFAAAQSTCTAKVILERCLEDTKPQVAICISNDYACLCERQKAVLTCYNNCPNDQGIHAQTATVTALCNAAQQVADSNSRISEAENATKTTSAGKSSKTSSSSPTTTDETSKEDSTTTKDESTTTTTKAADSAAAPTGVQKLFVAAAALAAVAVL